MIENNGDVFWFISVMVPLILVTIWLLEKLLDKKLGGSENE